MPTVTATPSLLYVARMSCLQPFFVRTAPRAPWVPVAQSVVRPVAPLVWTRSPMASFLPGKKPSTVIGALSLSALVMYSFGSGGGGGATDEKDGAGAEVSSGSSAGAGSLLALPAGSLLPPPVVTTAVATIAPTTAVASTPPPIISHRLRRARAADSSASAAQSGVPLSPGPQEGPPCHELMRES